MKKELNPNQPFHFQLIYNAPMTHSSPPPHPQVHFPIYITQLKPVFKELASTETGGKVASWYDELMAQ